jgi:phosphatidylserine/phosphatidylglycerophosphate/cardiolipin synthase-like enzyme
MRLFKTKREYAPFPASELFDEEGFYPAFLNDIKSCKDEIIIESPFLTEARSRMFYSNFHYLIKRNIKIYVVTKDLEDLEDSFKEQSLQVIQALEKVGVEVLLCLGNHHRKLAILDREILWEGSLNILSQAHSREIMRRINDKLIIKQMWDFLNLDKFL